MTKLEQKQKELIEMLVPGCEFYGEQSDKFMKLYHEIAELEKQAEEQEIDYAKVRKAGMPCLKGISCNLCQSNDFVNFSKCLSKSIEEQEPSKGAEEILFPLIWNKFKYKNNDPFEDKKLLVTIILNNLLQAMEQYRAEGLREELIKYDVEIYHDIHTKETSRIIVDEYLYNKQKP